MSTLNTEVIFLPDACSRESVCIPAVLYNRCRLLLSRCEYAHIFVPIRSLQYMAVIDAHEIIFVDSEAYAVRDGEGGRVVRIAWVFRPALRPDSLTEPVPIEVVYYHPQAHAMQHACWAILPRPWIYSKPDIVIKVARLGLKKCSRFHWLIAKPVTAGRKSQGDL